MSETANVRVAVRIRPLNGRELGLNSPPVVETRQANVITMRPPAASAAARRAAHSEAPEFKFDNVYNDVVSTDPLMNQKRVYNDLGEIIVKNSMEGFNSSLVAYGQTSSGKSHSMMGVSDADHNLGLIPRICNALFERAAEREAKDPSKAHKFECSYIEIYSERIRDLLAVIKGPMGQTIKKDKDEGKKELKVREHPTKGPYVEGLSVCAVSNFGELNQLIKLGNSERTVAATNMNSVSSRSHAVFMINFTTTTSDEQTKMKSDVTAMINLVDLAGSERAEQTGATGIRLKEASMINKSLTTLGRVISALSTKSGKPDKGSNDSADGSDPDFVPYRDSVLTYLLKESLGGNAKTVMLCCVSPADVNYDETLSTLRYAARAKKIVNKAVVNEDDNAKIIRLLRAEIDALKAKLQKGGGGGDGPKEVKEVVVNVPTVVRDEEYERQMEAKLAEMRKQMEENDRLMTMREMEWKSKLEETQQKTNESLRQLESRGVAIAESKMDSKAPDLPFLVNLNEDPSLSESLLYYLHPGSTVVGSAPIVESSPTIHSIILNGVSISPRHLELLHSEESGDVILKRIPNTDGEIHVNGELIFTDRLLRHGDRILVGQHHFFRFSQSKGKQLQNPIVPSLNPSDRATDTFDWAFAAKEVIAGREVVSKPTKFNRQPSVMPTVSISVPEEPTEDDTSDDESDGFLSSDEEEEVAEGEDDSGAADREGLSPDAPQFVFDSPENSPYQFHSLGALTALTYSSLESIIKREVRLLTSQTNKNRLREIAFHSKLIAANSSFLLSIRPELYSSILKSKMRWNQQRLQSSTMDAIMRMVMQCDEANAICSALGRAERFKVVLLPFNGTMGMNPLHFDANPSSPIMRIHSLRHSSLVIQEFKCRTRTSFHFLNCWSEQEFSDVLVELRDHYNELMEGAGSGNSTSTSSSSSSPLSFDCRFSHSLYCIGHAVYNLFGLRFGLSEAFQLHVVDSTGEIRGLLTVHIELVSIHNKSAAKAILSSANADGAVSLVKHSVDSKNIDDIAELEHQDDDINDHGDSDLDSSIQSHIHNDIDTAILGVIVTITSFQCNDLIISSLRPPSNSALTSAGLRSIAVQYRLHDDEKFHRTKFIKSSTMENTAAMMGDDSEPNYEMKFNYQKTHLVPSSSALTLGDFLMLDGISFDVWANFDDAKGKSGPTSGHRGSITATSTGPSSKSLVSRSTSVASSSASSIPAQVSAPPQRLENLLFACIDIEEEDKKTAGQWSPTSIKFEADGSCCFRVSMFKPKRLIISILQVDHSPFILESISSVLLVKLSRCRQAAAIDSSSSSSSSKSPTVSLPLQLHSTPIPSKESPFFFPLADQFAHLDHKLLVSTAAWSTALHDHDYLHQPTADKERIHAQILIQLFFSKTTIPVIIPINVVMKVYKSSPSSSLFGKSASATASSSSSSTVSSASASSESADRLPRLGAHFLVTRTTSKQSSTAVFNEFDKNLNALIKKLRLNQLNQFSVIESKLRLYSPQIFSTAESKFYSSLDSFIKIQSFQFSSLVANLKVNAGIQITVDSISRDEGIKCGFLTIREGTVTAAQTSKGTVGAARWSVLRPPYLFYYEKRSDKKEKGIFHLFGATYQRVETAILRDAFVVTTPAGVTTIQAASKEEMEAWVTALGAKLD